MPRAPFRRSDPDPRRSNNFLDTCAFDPKYTPEHEAAQEIRALSAAKKVQLLLAHSNQKEVDHPNTPTDVKKEADGMIYTIKTSLTDGERAQKVKILEVLTGNGNADKYAQDAEHVFEAGKYGGGYFITTDKRILDRVDELRHLSGALIVLPTVWLKIYNDAVKAFP